MKYLKEIDFLSPSPTLRLFSKRRFQTYFGGFISILTAIAIMSLSINFTLTTLNRNNINITKNEIKFEDLNYSFNNYPHKFTITDSNGNQFKEHLRYFNISVLNSLTDVNTNNIKLKELKVDENCFKKFKKYWPDIDMNYKDDNDNILRSSNKDNNFNCINQV